MSDEEDESMSEGFSASEDEWKPNKSEVRRGESSDDDDSDFEDGAVAEEIATKKRDPVKNRTGIKQLSAKKRKPLGQSLRAKLYNKYRPPPKTITSPSNSPSASTSRKASKNVQKPNESRTTPRSGADDSNSSDSSVDDYLVKPSELDLMSSFFDVNAMKTLKGSSSPTPVFDCNAGMTKLSDSGSEDNSESSGDEDIINKKDKAFDFRNLLDKANSLERVKETIAKRAADSKSKAAKQKTSAIGGGTENAALDVTSLLALGEMQNSVKAANDSGADDAQKNAPQKLNKTKSTRVKRHTKTRPTSTVVPGDTDDSDWEDVVADESDGEPHSGKTTHNATHAGNLEIHVEMPSRHRSKKAKQLQDLENALKRKLNREIKERQLLLHKTSLLCCFGRSYFYNRLLNDTKLMQATLKLLPSKNVYPPESGTELKYYHSMVTWFKTAVKLQSPNLYPDKMAKRKALIKEELLKQIEKREARSKQDMIFIFIVLLRGMGLQCRMVVNMQPLPLRPSQADLLKIKLKRDGDNEKKDGDNVIPTKKPKVEKAPLTKPAKEDKSKKTDKKENSSKNKRKERSSSKVEKPTEINLSIVDEEVLGFDVSRIGEIIDGKSPGTKVKEIKNELNKRQEIKRTITTIEDGKSPKTKISEIKNELNKREGIKRNIRDKVNLEEIKSESKKGIKRNIRDKVIPEEIKAENNKSAQEMKNSQHEVHVKPEDIKNQNNEEEQSVDDEKSKINQSKIKNSLSEVKPFVESTAVAKRTRKASAAASTEPVEAPVQQSKKRVKRKLPKINIISGSENCNPVSNDAELKSIKQPRSRSTSPKLHISPSFLQTDKYKDKFAFEATAPPPNPKPKSQTKVKISPKFLRQSENDGGGRVLRTRQKSNEPTHQSTTNKNQKSQLNVPQLDGADDDIDEIAPKKQKRSTRSKKTLKKRSNDDDDDNSESDFEPSPPKKPKQAPLLPKAVQNLRKDRRVLSTDDDEKLAKRPNKTAADLWIEVWSDKEQKWICVDMWKGKLDSVESIRKSASASFAYVFAFQNDLSLKDVTARYCPHWTTTVRKSRVESAWLSTAISAYCGHRTKRDIREDAELRRIHEEKPMPTSISDYKDHPLYALERHLLKFQAIYPPEPPTLGFVRGEPVYSRDCIHTLHSREIWLKQARTVKLGEQPYKIVKARPKWDRITQTVIKDQPLEIFGYWQTEDYDPPTAENGLVPRNAYGNVELFKECMLPKKTVHMRLPGLNRICKKLNIDCANAVNGFDFHQGACHPTYDGFVICEEFEDTVRAAWEQDQHDQERKDQEKYEARVYGNWKKLIRGLLIKQRLKKKYNF